MFRFVFENKINRDSFLNWIHLDLEKIAIAGNLYLQSKVMLKDSLFDHLMICLSSKELLPFSHWLDEIQKQGVQSILYFQSWSPQDWTGNTSETDYPLGAFALKSVNQLRHFKFNQKSDSTTEALFEEFPSDFNWRPKSFQDVYQNLIQAAEDFQFFFRQAQTKYDKIDRPSIDPAEEILRSLSQTNEEFKILWRGLHDRDPIFRIYEQAGYPTEWLQIAWAIKNFSLVSPDRARVMNRSPFHNDHVPEYQLFDEDYKRLGFNLAKACIEAKNQIANLKS